MKILLFRHGETIDNVSSTMTGHLEGELSDKGREQVRLLGKRFAEESIVRILSSDLGRARSTAEAVASHYGHEVEYTYLLRERCYGIYQGRSLQEYRRDRDSADIAPEFFKPREGEAPAEVRVRVEKFIETLKYRESEVVAVSAHSDLNRMFLGILLDLKYEAIRKLPQANTCVNTIVMRPDGSLFVKEMNNVVHLENSSFNR